MQPLTNSDWTMVYVMLAIMAPIAAMGILTTMRRNRTAASGFEVRMNWLAEVANLTFYAMVAGLLLPAAVIEHYVGSNVVLLAGAGVSFLCFSAFNLWQVWQLNKQQQSSQSKNIETKTNVT